MRLKLGTDLIDWIQDYHLSWVRRSLILKQENRYFNACFWIKKLGYRNNINNISRHFIKKARVLLIDQEIKRVNPHSQFCAYHSRFRPC